MNIFRLRKKHGFSNFSILLLIQISCIIYFLKAFSQGFLTIYSTMHEVWLAVCCKIQQCVFAFNHAYLFNFNLEHSHCRMHIYSTSTMNTHIQHKYLFNFNLNLNTNIYSTSSSLISFRKQRRYIFTPLDKFLQQYASSLTYGRMFIYSTNRGEYIYATIRPSLHCSIFPAKKIQNGRAE